MRTKITRRLGRKADSVLALSGTPLTNKPDELWSVMNIIRPDVFPDRWKYRWRYCDPKRTLWGWKFDGSKRKKELRRILLKTCMIRRRKKDVAPELPAKIHKLVPFQMSPKETAIYEHARKNFMQVIAAESLMKAERAKRAKALAQVRLLLRTCAKLKARWVIKWLKDFEQANPGKKVVAMTMHTEVINYLRAAFPKNCVVVNGSVRGRKRQESVRRFQSNRKTTFFFGNWKAAGAGLNLQASNTFVSIDYPWSAGDYRQGQDRVHRIGQTKTVMIYHLVLLGTIEQRYLRALQKKDRILSAVLDGEDSESKGFDLLDMLLKEAMR